MIQSNLIHQGIMAFPNSVFLVLLIMSSHFLLQSKAVDKVVKKTINVGGKTAEQSFTEEEKFQDIFELTGKYYRYSTGTAFRLFSYV